MINLQKFGKSSALKLVSFNCIAHHLRLDKVQTWPTGSFYFSLINPRFYANRSCICPSERYGNSTGNDENIVKISSSARKLAQAALFEYLHCTGSLQFMDAEHISKNSPIFLENLIRKADKAAVDIEREIARFLRYNPINEFEPFFESTGLKPQEYSLMLPRNSIFLGEDELLLGNYHVLCNFGVERSKIGMIFKGASEVFKYKSGALLLKIQAYEKLGLSRSFVAKLIVSSPYLLIGDLNRDFVEVLEKLKSVGLELSWFEENCSYRIFYRWSQILGLLSLLSREGCSNEQLNRVIRQHPEVLFEDSGQRAFSLIGFLFKFGLTIHELCLMFLQFPEIHVAKFVSNLRRGFLLLTDIDMEPEDIGKVMRRHSLLLGQCDLKKSNSILVQLNVGKRRLCKIIQEDPQVMKNWVLGSKINKLPNLDGQTCYLQKIKFLSGLGFVHDSMEMKNALKVFRGKGDELQDRFDCLVRVGLDPEDVAEMARVAPQILNQSKDVIEMKVDYLVKVLGYTVSTLVTFPSYLNYQIKRVKFRCMMYKWLVDRGAADPQISLTTIVSSTEKTFIRRYVKQHPNGLQVFQELKRGIYEA